MRYNGERCQHGHTIDTHPNCFLKSGKPRLGWFTDYRLGFLDIETTNLKANIGIILSWYIKSSDGNYEKYVLSRKEIVNKNIEDKNAVKALCKALKNYDMIVGYYSKRFDIPFIRTRAIKHGIDFPVYNELYHLDLYDVVKRKMKLNSNRLATATHFLGIDGKTPLEWEDWRYASWGDKTALQEVGKHNKGDVDILERLFELLKPHIRFTRSSI